MIKAALIMALAGHILCGVSDCLLGYSRKGRLDLKNINDEEKMAAMFADMPLSFPLVSMLLGTFAILLFGFGYMTLSYWMSRFSAVAANIMFISAMVFLIPIVTHHVFCGAVEWLYIRLDRKGEVRTAVLEMQKKTISTMFAGYAGLMVFLITLFIMTVTGRTDMPAWGCIFNTLVFMLLMLPSKMPAKGNIAGALMYLGLIFMI
ncbi:MAG: hypothetical protein II936_00880 [Oscillospiraceae bacterium]|nr:hypothetical protein [Oscillospiraceae bacterium]